MDEFITQFTSLLRYVPYIQEKAKVQWFVSSLPLAMRERIEFDNLKTMDEVIQEARICYQQSKGEVMGKNWADKKVGYANSKDKTATLESIPVVQEFADVFPEEIPGLPPKRDIDFTIELVPGAAPVSRAPYHMSTPKLTELKMQLQELLDKNYIRPSVSPWGAPVLFVKKKDGTLHVAWTTTN
eukprot:PITA_21979